MVLSPSTLLVAAALIAAPSALSLSIKPSPPSHPPKSLSSRSSSRVRPQHQQRSSPLRAYTVADNNNNKSWLSLWKISKSFEDFTSQFGAAEDSLFSFEGGSATKVATRPLMPNLEVEAAMDMSTEKDDGLLSELNALTKSFSDLQSSMDYKSQLYDETIKNYEFKVDSLEEKNTLLEEGLNRLTVSMEGQNQQLQELQQGKKGNAAKEEKNIADDVGFLLQAQENVKVLEGDNEMLRLRLRALEVELSDIAFESRKVIPAALATVANHSVAVQTDVKDPSSAEAVAISVNSAKLSPKEPVPPHIYQQRQFEQLQLQVEEYTQERSSVRTLFGLGIRRGVNKVGRALNLWSPLYNMILWGELRG